MGAREGCRRLGISYFDRPNDALVGELIGVGAESAADPEQLDHRLPVAGDEAVLQEHGIRLEVLSLHQTSLSAGPRSDALTLVEFRDTEGTSWSARRHRSVLRASADAVLQAAGSRRVPVGKSS
ncbi:MAG: hypothetical protein AAGC66_00140 [Leifsonia sp.]